MLKVSTILALGLSALVLVGCSQSDAGITTAVKSRFAMDGTVKAYQIDVDTQNGVVTISGAVDNADAKQQAVALARETEGVTDVVDQLTVSPTATFGERAEGAMAAAAEATSDAAITATIKTKMMADMTVSGLKVDVDTRDGIVTLTGTVPTAGERDRAVAVARGTSGVKDVEDKLMVGNN
jgi:hyperosmotically inducible protein